MEFISELISINMFKKLLNMAFHLVLMQHSCNLNLRTRRENLTPLHIAVHEGYSVIMEWLVGYGADLNAVSSDGNTVLHLAISRKNMKAPCARTPQLQQV